MKILLKNISVNFYIDAVRVFSEYKHSEIETYTWAGEDAEDNKHRNIYNIPNLPFTLINQDAQYYVGYDNILGFFIYVEGD